MSQEDRVCVGICTWKPLNELALAIQVLERLLAEGNVFMFDTMGYEEPLNIDFDVERAVEMWCSSSSLSDNLIYSYLFLDKSQPPHTNMLVRWQTQPEGVWLNGLQISLDASYLESPENLSSILKLVSELYMNLDCGYGYISDGIELESKDRISGTLPSGATIEQSIMVRPQEGLIDLYWANFFGPPYVKLFGEERIRSCPAHNVTKIGEDSYYLLISAHPSEWSDPEIVDISERAKKHLNPDVFFDRSHPERTPTPPDWPPEYPGN